MSNEACPTAKDALNEFKALRRLKGQYVWDIIPSYPTAVWPCSIALASLAVKQVSVERLFAMKPLLSGLLSRLKQDAVEAMLLLRANII